MRDPLGEAADRSDKTDRMEREPGGEAAILLRDRPGGAACGGRAGAISRRPDMRLDGGSVRPRLSTKNSKRKDEVACEACVFTWRPPDSEPLAAHAVRLGTSVPGLSFQRTR